ncbi:hypothetical protein RSOLAG1IB_04993 [Rhizoctonia solani AG-1 IB]|uniref:Uncharacterized protein n=1 Tax=Thanatephorus cucumeris (strain AG1-IB / isolate 7/3/14) TaxID=1108050 RepID=A0A0B7G2H9_THACB|nr:hypothetical protein RSOLAG1IB_04993 [Rhizoctonia solani AG-1 IB]
MNSFMSTLRLLARSSLVETPEGGLPDVPMTTFRNSSSSPRSSVTSSEIDLERGGVWSSEFPSPSVSPVSSQQSLVADFAYKLSLQFISTALNHCI